MNILYQNIIVYSLIIVIGLIAIGFGLVKKTKRELPIILSISAIITIFIYTIIVNPSFSSVMSALSTIALALVAGVTLYVHYQTMKDARDRESRDRKERLLNEIIEWAEDIGKSSSENVDPKYVILDSPVMAIASQQEFLQLRKRYQGLNKKSAYMKEAISKVFGCELVSAVEKVIQQLDNNIEMLRGCLTRKDEKSSEKVEECKKSLDCCAEELIIEATKIKTKDIN